MRERVSNLAIGRGWPPGLKVSVAMLEAAALPYCPSGSGQPHALPWPLDPGL